MKLSAPFLISSALCPALKIGDATLSLVGANATTEGRYKAEFELQTPTFTYVDDTLQSGVGGFRSVVEIFEAYLSFMSACGESLKYYGDDGECASIFPPNVAQWCAENLDEIDMVWWDITDDVGNPNVSLIEE